MKKWKQEREYSNMFVPARSYKRYEICELKPKRKYNKHLARKMRIKMLVIPKDSIVYDF